MSSCLVADCWRLVASTRRESAALLRTSSRARMSAASSFRAPVAVFITQKCPARSACSLTSQRRPADQTLSAWSAVAIAAVSSDSSARRAIRPPRERGAGAAAVPAATTAVLTAAEPPGGASAAVALPASSLGAPPLSALSAAAGAAAGAASCLGLG